MSLSPRRLLTFTGIAAATAFLAAPFKALSTSLAVNVAAATETALPAANVNIWEALVLGIVQGLTEFLPISSTAHLKVIPVALGWGDPGVAFTAVIQLGSIAAVLWYFWKDLADITTGSIQAIRQGNYEAQEFRMALGIILGTIPICVFGLLIKKLIPDFDHSPLRSLGAIAAASIAMSILLGIAEKFGSRERNFDSLKLQDGILMGLAQCLALIPGVSRSGSTLTAGLFMSLERETAARFSFLLGIPAITLAGILELKDALQVDLGSGGIIPLVVGTIVAAVVSYAAIAWLLGYLKTQNTWVFIWYRLVFGAAILGAIATGILQNV